MIYNHNYIDYMPDKYMFYCNSGYRNYSIKERVI